MRLQGITGPITDKTPDFMPFMPTEVKGNEKNLGLPTRCQIFQETELKRVKKYLMLLYLHEFVL